MMRRLVRVVPLFVLAAACARFGRAESMTGTDYAPFSMSATTVDSALSGTFSGRMRRVGDEVELIVESGRIRYAGSARYAGPREINSLAFALAQGDRDDFWRIASRGNQVSLRRVLDAGEELPLESLRFRVSRRGLPLAEYWLVAEVENVLIDVPATAQPRGIAYLHSGRNIFEALGNR